MAPDSRCPAGLTKLKCSVVIKLQSEKIYVEYDKTKSIIRGEIKVHK